MSENKKGMYHSELVRMGPVAVTVKSDVLRSKFKDKPDYVILEIDGAERIYNTENDECADFFRDQKGRTFTLVAEGREADAILTYVGEGVAEEAEPRKPAKSAATKPPPKSNRPPREAPRGAQRPQERSEAPEQGKSTPPAANRQEQRPPAPSPETPEQKLAKAKAHANRVANCYLIAFTAADYARTQVKEQLHQDLTAEQFQGCIAMIAIQLSKDGFQHAVPTGVLHLKNGQGAAK